jgi:putative tryptophan/tyrosine transport system substrate-binding protein
MRRRDFIGVLGGAAVLWPLSVRAQQQGMPLVGFMSARALDDSTHLLAAFHQGLAEEGFVERQNVAIEYRWAGGEYDRLPAMAADLVRRQVRVLVAVGGEPSALAAKRATSTIPIVFGIGSDPVSAGLVDSVNRPGANVTGATLLTTLMEPKRFGLLHELAPAVAVVGVLLNPTFPPATRQLQALEQAAQSIKQKLMVRHAATDAELDAAFAALVEAQVGALLVAADPYFDVRRDRIIAFAHRQKLPAIYQFREYAAAGGLLSYGPSITDVYKHYGLYTAKILKGAKPAELPIWQPIKYELVINLQTAKSLGVNISDNLLSLADEVIE